MDWFSTRLRRWTKSGWVFERNAFEQQGLVEEEPGGVGYAGVVGVGEELS